MTNLSCSPLWKENNKLENVTCVLYYFHGYPMHGGVIGGAVAPLYVAPSTTGGSRGGEYSPPIEGYAGGQ